nr:semaphorin-5B-like [Salvelinus alpinus]XP_023862320.1 semaphorin-5B-like [Salvelinus alpinus]
MTAALPRNAAPLSVPGLLLLPLLLLPLPIALSQKPMLPSPPAPTPAPQYLSRPECTRREHPVVTFQALSPWITIFSHPDVRDYSQLTLDLTRNELIVGARNFLFRLSLNNVSLIQVS